MSASRCQIGDLPGHIARQDLQGKQQLALAAGRSWDDEWIKQWVLDHGKWP